MASVLAIAASPRKGGNSDRLLDAFLEGARSSGHGAEKLYAVDLRITPCDENNTCHRTGICRIKDDMQGVYEKLLSADAIVIGSPTFFMGPPAQLKALIDRCQALWAKRFVLKKPLRSDDKERKGYLLATSGLESKRAFVATKEIVKAFFYVLDFKYADELFFEGVDKRGDIDKREGALDAARKLGASI